jgi:hypothetical protein
MQSRMASNFPERPARQQPSPSAFVLMLASNTPDLDTLRKHRQLGQHHTKVVLARWLATERTP